jgi:hypothetical protein
LGSYYLKKITVGDCPTVFLKKKITMQRKKGTITDLPSIVKKSNVATPQEKKP